MPRKRKPPRLYLREDEQVWIIRDGPHDIRTGCGADDSRGAEEALARYLSEKFKPAVRERDPDRLSVAEVLTAYGREHAPDTKGAATIGYNIAALAPFWGARMLSSVTGQLCKQYGQWRGKAPGTVRRELSTLQAAINYWHGNHGPLYAVPQVTLPAAPEGMPHWLTRSESALLLAGALGWYRERWCDIGTRKVHQRWRRDHSRIHRHAARFILLGLYTGTRSGAIVAEQWMPNTLGGWVDLEAGVIHRRGIGEVETNKRKPPAKLGRKILAHLRRWKRLDDRERDRAAQLTGAPVAKFLHIVHYDGDPVLKIRRSWASAVELAGLGDEVTPHVLRHTRATWLMQAGIDLWEAAGSIGMTVQMLEKVYGHHHPGFQQKAAEV